MIILVVVLFITYIYSFIIATSQHIPDYLRKINQSCIMKCENDCSMRDNSYIIEDKERSKEIKKCLITAWNVSHFCMYIILGYFYPQHYIKLTMLGVGFEMYEHIMYDCADAMDIPSNIAGICVGVCASTW